MTWRGMLLTLLPMLLVVSAAGSLLTVTLAVGSLMIPYTPYVVMAQIGCFQKVAQVDRKRGNKSR